MNNQTSVSFWELLGKVDPCPIEMSSLAGSFVKSTRSSLCVDWSQAEGNPVKSSVLSMEVSVCSGLVVSERKRKDLNQSFNC